MKNAEKIHKIYGIIPPSNSGKDKKGGWNVVNNLFKKSVTVKKWKEKVNESSKDNEQGDDK